MAVAETETVDVGTLGTPDALPAQMEALGRSARAASTTLSDASADQKNKALKAAAAHMRTHTAEILEANRLDVDAGKAKGLRASLIDRLLLDEGRIDGIAAGLEAIADLPDPVGSVMAEWDRPNGLHIQRVRTPLGVIGIIYESRPNVTADAGGLCLKSGNAAILRGGSESFHSSRAIVDSMHAGLKEAGLPEAAVQLVPTTDRAAVGHLLTMPQWVDVIVPRGGRTLIERVQNESRVPVFSHLDGLCHVYVDAGADRDKARDIAVNAKMRRTSVCGAAETLLIDKSVAAEMLPEIADALAGADARSGGTIRRRPSSRPWKPRPIRIGRRSISTRSCPWPWSTGSRARSSTSIASAPTTRTPS